MINLVSQKIQKISINGLVQDCGISSVTAMEISQPYTKPSLSLRVSIWWYTLHLQVDN